MQRTVIALAVALVTALAVIAALTIAVAALVVPVGCHSSRVTTPKGTPEQAQQQLDTCWALYFAPPNQKTVAEMNARRATLRRQIRAILRHYPDWSARGPNPKESELIPSTWSIYDFENALRDNEKDDEK